MLQFVTNWEDESIARSLSRKNRRLRQFSILSQKVARLKAKAGCDRFPTDLSRLMREVGIVRTRDVALATRGRLLREPLGFAVEIDESLPQEDKRFVIAHEVIHLLLEGDAIRSSLGQLSRTGGQENRGYRQTEILCDFGAREILLPLNSLRPELRRGGPSLALLVDISNEAKCPLWMTVERTCEPVMLWECSFVWWKEVAGQMTVIKSLPRSTQSMEPIDVASSVVTRASRNPGQILKAVEEFDFLTESRSFASEALGLPNGDVLMLLQHGPS